MKTTFYAGSIAVVATMILIVASISTPALLLTQTAIASIDDDPPYGIYDLSSPRIIQANSNCDS